jgi:hypothetical protein
MKFNKEDANKELVAKMTAKGEKLNLSQRSMNEQVEHLYTLIANEEMELADFVEKVLPFVKTSDANVRNDVSQGIKDYKNQNPIVEPKKEPIVEPNNPNKELLERLEALEKKNRENELKLHNQNIKSNLSSKMKELGIKNAKWIDMMLDNVSITEDFDVDANATKYLELYNTMQADIDPSVTPNSTGGGKPDYTTNAIKEAAALAKANNLVG